MITQNIIAGRESQLGDKTMRVVNPTTQSLLPGSFAIATDQEIDIAVKAAKDAFKTYAKTSGKVKAKFLNAIAEEIENMGDRLVQRVMEESGLPEGRVQGERGRTCSQLRMFANLVEEGSWVDAVIDEAQPERTPLPKADIRKMARPIGPVAVFTASNFPLAFSTAGGDTASALASGCPVIVKAHPSHLGTNSLVSEAINNAIARCNLPGGIYSTLIGGIDVGTKLVSHKSIAAVAFTGSFNGGKALFDIATKRETPIPVYAEMGSVNPIFILPNKMATENKILADKIANSINLGAGQFCTNPGLIIVEKGKDTDAFLSHLKKAFEGLVPATMLNEGINNNFIANKNKCSDQEGVETLANQENNINDWKGYPGIATVVAKNFIVNPKLQEEIFGPFTLVVMCESKEQMINVAAVLHGQLTGTIFSDEREISGYEGLFDLLSEKVGRLIFNGVPTGVEVCPAMHHGGPYPASTNAMFTSVGTDAIKRFVKPVCYQDVPQSMLPVELLASNPLQIWRKVNGKLIK